MALPRPHAPTLLLPLLTRTPARAPARLFHATSPSRSGALFNLGGLAASREGQYLARERGLPRTEFSSTVHLIRSSEVDPFAPAPGASPSPSFPLHPRGPAGPRRREGAASGRPGRSASGGEADYADPVVGLAAEVYHLRAAVARLQERDAARAAAVRRLSGVLGLVVVVVVVAATAAVWHAGTGPEAAGTQRPASAPAALEAQARLEGGVAGVEAAGESVYPGLEPPAPAGGETAVERAVRRDQRAPGLLESLFWSSRQGR